MTVQWFTFCGTSPLKLTIGWSETQLYFHLTLQIVNPDGEAWKVMNHYIAFNDRYYVCLIFSVNK